MNKDKAIQLLERLQDPEPYEPMLTKDAYDAIQMAIDALSADGDTISRKAAIGVLHEALDRVDQIADVPFGVYQNYRDKMNELPPAQPAPDNNGDLWITVPDIDEVTCVYVQESKSKFCRIFYEEQEPAQSEPHWTPCGKELPTKSDTYLVSTNDKSVFNLYFSTEHGWDGWWDGRISAWQPLPEPYKEVTT